MVKSLAQLKRELVMEQRKGERLRVKANIKAERSKLRIELARIRNPGFFKASKVISSGARKLGKGLLTQGKLIKIQQEREIAEDKKFQRKLKQSTVIKKRRPIRIRRRRRK